MKTDDGYREAFAVWLVGLCDTGMDLLATSLEENIRKRGVKRVEILGGHLLETRLGQSFGVAHAGREIGMEWVAMVSHLLTRNGVVVFVIDRSSGRSLRERARRLIGRFVEVHVRGTGAAGLPGGESYEQPSNPDSEVDLQKESSDESVARVVRKLEELGFMDPAKEYSAEEEEMVKDRLEKLGYL